MFANETCPAFSTQELRREAESHRRRQAREGGSSRIQTQGMSSVTGDRRPKVLNLRTYKLHALGDYPAQIRVYGTTDSYSTQSVKLSADVHTSYDSTYILSLGGT